METLHGITISKVAKLLKLEGKFGKLELNGIRLTLFKGNLFVGFEEVKTIRLANEDPIIKIIKAQCKAETKSDDFLDEL